MVFDPDTQKFVCEYCTSSFTNDEVTRAAHTHTEGAETQDTGGDVFGQSSNDASSDVFYTCPSCGAQIAASDTAIIATCFYCHNQIVRTESNGERFKADAILPFSVSKEKAKESFMAWAKKKKFVPRDFFSPKQIEHLSGVYYPYWLADYKTHAAARYDAQRVKVWQSGDTEFTSTSYYDVKRSGNLTFTGITKKALSKVDSRIAESVQPFSFDALVPYANAYLLGFQAQCRDIEKESVQTETDSEVKHYSESMLAQTADDYTLVTAQQSNVSVTSAVWKYILLPVWVVTYKAKNGKIYSYSLNGQTGKTCGELPVSRKRLGALFFAVFAAVFAVVSALEYFLW